MQTDENHEIRRIIAPDVLYNPYFGWGVHGRVYGYTSEDEQWSLVGGIKERVEREFDAEFQIGRLRQTPWSFNASLIYDRDGTPRFYGIGNESPESCRDELHQSAGAGADSGRPQSDACLAAAVHRRAKDRGRAAGNVGTQSHSIERASADTLGVGTTEKRSIACHRV